MLEDNRIIYLLNKRFGSKSFIFQQEGVSSYTAGIMINFYLKN